MDSSVLMEIPNEWIIALSVAFSAFCAAIWKYITAQQAKMEARMDNQTERLEGKLDKCEERHVERDEFTFELAAKVGKLEGMEAMTKRIEDVAKQLVEEVRNDP